MMASDTMGDAATPEPTLSVCMIVRDELKLLPGVFENLRSLSPKEIVVIDTGSTDGTQNRAREYGARVIEFSWRDDYAAARNVSFAEATGDWLMWWDADFRLAASGPPLIRSFMSSTVFTAASFVHHEGRDEQGSLERILSGERATAGSHAGAMQLLRRLAEPVWTGRVHEGVNPWAAARAAARGLQHIDTMLSVDVVHVGWSPLQIASCYESLGEPALAFFGGLKGVAGWRAARAAGERVAADTPTTGGLGRPGDQPARALMSLRDSELAVRPRLPDSTQSAYPIVMRVALARKPCLRRAEGCDEPKAATSLPCRVG